MTAAALIKEADAKRLARVAKAEGVSFCVEINGYKITVMPDIPDNHRDDPKQKSPPPNQGQRASHSGK